MAHYFKFHSVADVEAECRRLDVPLRFRIDLDPLFQPTSFGPLRAGNALCIQPMEGCDGTLDGEPDELTLRRYQRFGGGGAKLIWAEATAVAPEGRANPRQLLINEETAPALKKMLQVCRQAHRDAWGKDDDLIVGLQLTHSGRYSFAKPLLAVHDPILDSRTKDPTTGRFVDASYPLLGDDDLRRLVDHYVAAARLAYRIGYQFVDIKQCHRYLLSELLAAKDRPGLFGGSLENRTRLAREIIQAIRAQVPGLIIASRMNVYDGIPFGKKPDTETGQAYPWSAPLTCAWGTNTNDPLRPDLAEPLAWIEDMQRLGVTCVNVSMGNPYTNPHVVRPFEYSPPDGYETPEHPLLGVARHFALTAQVQRAFPNLPVVGSGYSYLQAFWPNAAAANLQGKACTFVGVGRAALAQPDFVKQLQDHGQLDRKRTCRTFSYCTALMRSKHNELGQFATGCPPFDKEAYGPIWEEAKKKER